jgi:signal transduction histidine kinase
MLTYASGAAYLDRTGAIVVADAGFLAAMGLPAHDPTGALRARAETNPALRALLGLEGPDLVQVDLGDGSVELRRVASRDGALLLVRTAQLQDSLEHGERSAALSRVIAGVAHDIKNPLNAMALQVAILSEKLSGEEGQGGVTTPHLGALREQIGRVNEVVRRFLDVTDPGAPLGYIEVGVLVADVAGLFAHEARRRRIHLAVPAPHGAARAAGDPARVGRLLLLLLAGAVSATPDGGRVEVGVETDDGRAILRLSHAVGDGERESGYERDVVLAAASALGAELTEEREEGVRHLVLRLPRIERT